MTVFASALLPLIQVHLLGFLSCAFSLSHSLSLSPCKTCVGSLHDGVHFAKAAYKKIMFAKRYLAT